MLSQWRAYAQDGRGGAITLTASGFARLPRHLPGFRINPIVYERSTQELFINFILSNGDAAYSMGTANAVEPLFSAHH
jgi:hypothetical protein